MNVRLWHIHEYDESIQLPVLIDLTWIRGGLGLSVVCVGDTDTKVWATIGLNAGMINCPVILS
jgi:hypothetical protein